MPSEKLDEESGLPKATIEKLIQDLTPDGFGVSKEVKSLLRDVAHSFVTQVILDANQQCDTENKKTISVNHVFKSMDKFGFGNFVSECEVSARNYDDYSKHKPSRQNKFKESGKSMEELQELQMQLFKEAAEQQKREYDIKEDSEEE